MNNKYQLKNNRYFNFLILSSAVVVFTVLTACSSSIPAGEPIVLQSAEDMKAGPGLFSGEKGAFYIVGGEKDVKPQTVSAVRPVTKSVSNMDLNETSKVLDDKIRQLQRDQMELELLKREIDRKLKN